MFSKTNYIEMKYVIVKLFNINILTHQQLYTLF